MLIITFCQIKVGEKNEKKAYRLNLYPITNHGNLNPNLDYGLCGDHTFANPTSPSAPFVQLTRFL
jgi:hypothetical protein